MNGRSAWDYVPTPGGFLFDPTEHLERADSRARALLHQVDVVDDYLKSPAFSLEIRDSRTEPGRRHARWTAKLPELLPSLRLEVAAIAVELRSCLDMAIVEVSARHSSEWKRPQFPIVHGEEGADCMAKVNRFLPQEYAEVIESVQPRYDVEGLGHFDVPVSHTLLELRDLSNTNKHIRTTPVVFRRSMSGYVGGLGLTRVMSAQDSAWDDSSEHAVELTFAANDEDKSLDGLRVTCSSYLAIANADHRYQGEVDRQRAVRLADFLRNGPTLVGLVLRTFRQAEDQIRDPKQPFTFSGNIGI